MNRRTLLGTMGALAATAPLARPAQTQPASDPVNVSREAEALYKNALGFDANLNPPVQDTFPFPPAMLDMVRRSGVTACKTSLGGIDESFEDTVAEIAFFQRIFEEYPNVFLQVREHCDFARARREGRMGVLLSFEAVSMLEDKVDRIELFRD